MYVQDLLLFCWHMHCKCVQYYIRIAKHLKFAHVRTVVMTISTLAIAGATPSLQPTIEGPAI